MEPAQRLGERPPRRSCTREAALLRNGERTVFQRRSADPLIFYIPGRHIQRPRLRITEGTDVSELPGWAAGRDASLGAGDAV